MRNQNKRQTNGLLAIIFNKTFSLCIKLHICWNIDDVTKNWWLKIKQLKNSENWLNIQNGRQMLAKLNSSNAHNFPIFQPILI